MLKTWLQALRLAPSWTSPRAPAGSASPIQCLRISLGLGQAVPGNSGAERRPLRGARGPGSPPSASQAGGDPGTQALPSAPSEAVAHRRFAARLRRPPGLRPPAPASSTRRAGGGGRWTAPIADAGRRGQGDRRPGVGVCRPGGRAEGVRRRPRSGARSGGGKAPPRGGRGQPD